MPEEILAIIIISIVSFTILSVIRMILGYRERTRGVTKSRSGGKGQSSMTTSELEQMMRDAVRDSVSPMERRLAAIERTLGGTALLPEADTEHRIEEIEEVEEVELGARRTARRSRA